MHNLETPVQIRPPQSFAKASELQTKKLVPEALAKDLQAQIDDKEFRDKT